MTEITDEFKVTIVEAVRTLALKFPNKQSGFLTFLSGILRDEGGFEFKRAVVEAIMDLIRFVPEAKEDALATLCEFIEDCEFTKLAVRILFLLGREGPSTLQPTKYIRYIYNRVVLENAIVRAAATSALAKFGVGYVVVHVWLRLTLSSQKDAEIKKSVHVLLTRCLDDVDDEVRDRAALNLRLMDEDDAMAVKFIRNGASVARRSDPRTDRADSMFSLPVLEYQLAMYVSSDSQETFAAGFDISKVPTVSREQADAEDRTKKLNTATPTLKAPSTGPKPAPKTGADAAASATAAAQKYAAQLQQIPEMAAYGGVLKSSSAVELTESETEYVVSAVKHIFKDYVVLQYDIKNTLPETVLLDVQMVVTASDDDDVRLEEEFIIPAPKLVTNEPGTVYVSFKRLETESPFVVASFSNVLKFTSKEIDPSTGEPEEGDGYEDEYQVEDIELNGADYVVPAYAVSFDNVWTQAGAGESAVDTLQLSNVKSIAGTCNACSVWNDVTEVCRCHRAAHQDAVPAAARGHGRGAVDVDAHAEAVRQDGHGRQSGGESADGVLGQDRRHYEDRSARRGGGRGSARCRQRSVSKGGRGALRNGHGLLGLFGFGSFVAKRVLIERGVCPRCACVSKLRSQSRTALRCEEVPDQASVLSASSHPLFHLTSSRPASRVLPSPQLATELLHSALSPWALSLSR